MNFMQPHFQNCKSFCINICNIKTKWQNKMLGGKRYMLKTQSLLINDTIDLWDCIYFCCNIFSNCKWDAMVFKEAIRALKVE